MSRFHQIKLEESSRDITSFSTNADNSIPGIEPSKVRPNRHWTNLPHTFYHTIITDTSISHSALQSFQSKWEIQNDLQVSDYFLIITTLFPKAYYKNSTDPFLNVTRRVKWYTRFVKKFVTGRRKRFRLYKVYIFLMRINSRVDLAMSVCTYERRDLRNYKR